MKKKLIAFLSVFTTLAIALSGCSGDKTGGSSGDESSITIGIPQDLEESLDPHVAVAAGTHEIMFNIYEGLVKPDPDGNMIPAVASSYSVEDEGKTYIFTLRDGVKFHDGTTVTVQDVVYSLSRCADTSLGSPMVAAFSNLESVKSTDDRTIVVSLVTPDTDFLAELTVAIIPEHNETPDTVAIGTGPYMYVSRSIQDNIVLTRFDDYWGEKANIKDITLKVIADSDMIVTNLQSGAIDMICRITTDQAKQIEGLDYNVYEGTMNLVQALYLNNAVEPLNNPLVRQALCYGVDRQEILDLGFDGKGTIIGSSMFPAFGKYYMDELSSYYQTDVQKAKDLLAEAGYPNGFDLTITVPSNYTQHVDTAQIISQQLEKIGVNVKIQLIEWESWVSDVYVGREFEATVIGVDASTLTAPSLLNRFVSDNGKNFINFSSAAYDESFAKAKSLTDDAGKTESYKRCEQILTEEAANVYIQDMACLVALNNKYDGYVFYPLYVQDFSKLYVK